MGPQSFGDDGIGRLGDLEIVRPFDGDQRLDQRTGQHLVDRRDRHDLIAAVAASTNLTKTDAANAVDAILTVVTKSLKKKEKVLLVGFGTFQVSRRKAGEGRNPQTGEKLKIPAANVPRFKASKALKDAIN